MKKKLNLLEFQKFLIIKTNNILLEFKKYFKINSTLLELKKYFKIKINSISFSSNSKRIVKNSS